MAKLTPKQKRFVDEYLVDLNASAACIRAGYKSKNPDVDGHNLLVKPSIASAIAERVREREKRTEVTQDMVVQQLAKIAFHDITQFVTWGGDGVDIKPSDEVDGTVIAEVGEDVTDFGDHKRIKKRIKMPDRLRALEMLGKHLGMFTEKVELSGQVKDVHEHQTHIIHELVGDEEIARRVRERFRRDMVQNIST